VFAIRPALGKKKSNSAWPILLTNYNITPEVCNRLDNLLPVTVIPGPNGPKCLDSFFVPLIEELHCLARGVHTYDAATNEHFDLHAHLILFSGDLPAMSKLLCLRGTNAHCPCRFCLIRGEHDQTKRPGKQAKTTYYPALQAPRRLGQRRDDGWDPNNLPVCTYNTHLAHLTEKSGMLNQIFVRNLEYTMGSTDCHDFCASNRSDSWIHFHTT
jgi:Transposase family tnp2